MTDQMNKTQNQSAVAGQHANPVALQARRLCESGDPSCTGVAPCQHCFVFIMTRVVPLAMRVTNVVQTKEQAEAFFRNFINSYRETLETKVKEHNSGAIAPPVTTPTLLAYLEFRKYFQEGHSALLAWVTSLGPTPAPLVSEADEALGAVLDKAGFTKTSTPAKKPGNRNKKKSKNKKTSKGSVGATTSRGMNPNLERGDLRRIAEKHTEKSLASRGSAGLGSSAVHGAGSGNPAVRRDYATPTPLNGGDVTKNPPIGGTKGH